MIDQLIRQIAKSEPAHSLVCKVLSVDESTRTCNLEPINNDANLLDIRLQAEVSNDLGLVSIPAVDSFVICTMTGPNDGYVAAFSKVDKWLLKVEEQTIEFTKQGLSWANEQTSLLEQVEALIKVVSDTLETLKTFQLATNMGPTVQVMPQVVIKLNQHATDLESVKSAIKTLIY